jgi:signal transduction histidine kinase
VKGQNWFEMLVPRDRYPEVHEEFTRLMRGGLPRSFENPIQTRDGQERFISWRNSATRIGDEIVGITSFGIDITKRRTAEQRLRESEEQFRQLMEQSPLSIQILAPDGRITKVNRSWMELWGIDEASLPEVLAKYNILEDEEARRRGVMPLIERAFGGESVTLPVIEYDAAATLSEMDVGGTEAGKRWINVRLYPVKDAEGEVMGIVDIEEDVTEQKLAELKVQAYQDRLRALAAELTLTEEQERRRIASELHDGAAQSLAFARMQLAAAKKTVAEPGAVAKLDGLSLLLKESLQQIRGVLLDLSSPALNEIGLAAALSEWLEEQVSRRHGLRTAFEDTCGDLPLTDDVRSLLFRNARELLMNAVKHAQASKVSVKMASTGGALRITVADDGIGLDAGTVAQRPSSGGAFGLFSIRERMKDMGGTLEIVSAPGEGTRATLLAPVGKAKTQRGSQ